MRMSAARNQALIKLIGYPLAIYSVKNVTLN